MFINTVKEDIQSIFERDPAATSVLEVILCYSGLHALFLHRIAHKLWGWKVPILPRFISTFSRFLTGIEIHPGATIGKRFFIDHGMGVVIGETTIVGDDVLVYQGVTLGGTGKQHEKRHPTIGNGVIVGAGAKVLGNITIGNYSRIGSGSVVVSDVPEHSTVVGIPGRVIVQNGIKTSELGHNQMPDMVACSINRLSGEIKELREIIKSKIE